jgi:DNA-binding response OmpR family regulator
VSYKIIIADESPSTQRAIQLAFPESEFRLFPFENGLELLKAVPEIHPDACLIGLSLSGHNGYDVALVLRRRPETRGIPIFFLKGTFESFDEEKTGGIEHEGVVVKPFDSGRLVALVQEAIERRTTPVSLPEEPVWERIDEAAPSPRPSGDPGRNGLSSEGEGRRSGTESESPLGTKHQVPESQIRRWIRAEVYELEKELERRIRARILAECQDALTKKRSPGKNDGRVSD